MKNKTRELRKEQGLTQAELAEALGVSRQTVNAIENGDYNPSTSLAIKLSVYFDTTVNEMFELEEGD